MKGNQNGVNQPNVGQFSSNQQYQGQGNNMGQGQGNMNNQTQNGQDILSQISDLNNPNLNSGSYTDSTSQNSQNVEPMQFNQPMTNIQNQQAMQSGQGQVPNQVTVVAVRREGSEISQYKLSDGRVVGKDQAFDLAIRGELVNVVVANSSTGEPFIRSYPDGDPSNNLQNLPSF